MNVHAYHVKEEKVYKGGGGGEKGDRVIGGRVGGGGQVSLAQ